MQYFAPATIDEAVSLAAASAGTLRFLAGGTDVLVQLRSGRMTPDVVIDIKRIAGSSDIARNDDGSWRIGAAVPGYKISGHPRLGREWPGVVEAMDLIGSTQIQGRATLTGNLCNGSPAADSVPAMMAAGATVTIHGPAGEREVAVADLPEAPGRMALARAEIISAINLPARAEHAADAYLRFIPRSEMDIAVVGCAVSLRREGAAIAGARVALGAVAPTVRLVPDAAQAIIGSTLDDKALARLAQAASDACDPIDDKRGTVAFRRRIAGVLARRAALIAYQRAAGE